MLLIIYLLYSQYVPLASVVSARWEVHSENGLYSFNTFGRWHCVLSSGGTSCLIFALFLVLVSASAHCLDPLVHWELLDGNV